MSNWKKSAIHSPVPCFSQLTIYDGDHSTYQYLQISPLILKEVIIAWMKCSLITLLLLNIQIHFLSFVSTNKATNMLVHMSSCTCMLYLLYKFLKWKCFLINLGGQSGSGVLISPNRKKMKLLSHLGIMLLKFVVSPYCPQI